MLDVQLLPLEYRPLGDVAGHAFHGNQYVFHGTDASNLDAIKEHGLRPNAHGNPLNFHHIEESSRFYAGDKGVMLRVKKSDLPTDTVHDGMTSRSWTSTAVPRSKIEIEHAPGKWRALTLPLEYRPLGGPGSGIKGHVTEHEKGETYHGTSLSAAEKIKSEGLRPNIGGRVYVAKDLPLALSYAANAVKSPDGHVAVVVMNKSAAKFFDKKHSDLEHQSSPSYMAGKYHEGFTHVPAAYVKEVRIYKVSDIHATNIHRVDAKGYLSKTAVFTPPKYRTLSSDELMFVFPINAEKPAALSSLQSALVLLVAKRRVEARAAGGPGSGPHKSSLDSLNALHDSIKLHVARHPFPSSTASSHYVRQLDKLHSGIVGHLQRHLLENEQEHDRLTRSMVDVHELLSTDIEHSDIALDEALSHMHNALITIGSAKVRSPRDLARHPESAIHVAADAHYAQMLIVISAAFMRGRKAYKSGGLNAAISAIRTSLLATLEPVLLKCVEAGGHVAINGLPRFKKLTVVNRDGAPMMHLGTGALRTFDDPFNIRFDVSPPKALRTLWVDKDGADNHGRGEYEPTPLQPLKGKDIREALSNTYGNVINAYGSEVDIDPATVMTSQKTVDPKRVAEYVKDPTREADKVAGRGGENRLIVVERNGKRAVVDGNHRIAGALARGDSKIKVTLVNMDAAFKDAYANRKEGEGIGLALMNAANAKMARRLSFRTADGPLNIRFDVSDPNAVKWAREHAAELAKGLSETSRQDIQDAVANALDGDGIDAAYDDILAAVGDEDRADLIARTEIMDAANQGFLQGLSQAQDAGLLPEDATKQWIATSGCCDECDDLDGEEVLLDEDFSSGDDSPPAHPRCRCALGVGTGGGGD